MDPAQAFLHQIVRLLFDPTKGMVMKKWKCQVCGYIHTGDQPPAKCPVCGAPQSAFVLIDGPDQNDRSKEPPAAADDDIRAVGEQPGLQRKWKCQVCGYVHTGVQPPDKCPVCGAPRERFELVQEEETAAEPARRGDPRQDPGPLSDAIPTKAKSIDQIAARAEILTRLHGHPIAVHIPNGVLPLTFVFTLLAIIFKSEALATAAKYNMIFVCLSMPFVLATGVIDWFNRFNARLTSVFKIKMACGAGVTVLSLVLALWWAAQPEIYLGSEGKTGLFLFMNLIDLGLAALAGFYGGKLVFRE